MISLDMLENMIKARAGVPFIMSAPGGGKSAISEWIAKKNGWQYIDLRLSQMDQSEVTGLYDRKEVKVNGVPTKVADLLPQLWAVMANEKDTLVCFDELNRASREVRNSALQILNEKRLGWNFNFNKNVYFVACGNLGEEDNTDVEEFDDAMKNRLLPIKINVNDKGWIDQWLTWAEGEGQVHKRVTAFIRKNPESLFCKGNKDDLAFATARSWTYFSTYLKETNLHTDDKILDHARQILHLYVGGAASVKYLKFIEDNRQIKIGDILNNWEAIKETVAGLSRDKVSELLSDLGEKNINTFTKKQLGNVKEFCKTVDPDELVGYLQKLTESSYTWNGEKGKHENLRDFVKTFAHIARKVLEKSGEATQEATKTKT
jgi:hypothetical protein